MFKWPVNNHSECGNNGACEENPWNPANAARNEGPQQHSDPEDNANKGNGIENFCSHGRSFLKYYSNGREIDAYHDDDEKEGASWLMEERSWDQVTMTVNSVTDTQEAYQGSESHGEYFFRLKGSKVSCSVVVVDGPASKYLSED